MGRDSGDWWSARCRVKKRRGAGSGSTARACTATVPKGGSRPRALRPSAASNKPPLPCGERVGVWGKQEALETPHPRLRRDFSPPGRGNLLGTQDGEHTLEERRAALRRPGQPRDRFLQARTARAGQRQRRLVLMRVEHDLVPELGAKRTARDLLHIRAVVIPD